MSTPQVSAFSFWEFSEEEKLPASVFTELQEQHIRTEMATKATEMLNLEFDPTVVNPEQKYLLEMTFNRGYVAALTTLLNIHDDAKEELRAAAMQNLNTQT